MLLPLAATLGTLWLLLLGAGVPFPALRPVLGPVRDLVATRGGRLAGVWLLGILFLNLWETSIDPEIGPALQLDFTPLVYAFEGELVSDLQRVLSGWGLASFWAWVYVFLYPSLLLAPAFVYHARGDFEALRGYIGAFSINYLVALPFYVFVPVLETGISQSVAAQPVLDYVWPQFLALLRSSSAPDNCFPSLHASCSLTVAFFALRHGPRRLARIAGVCAALVVLSTWALGIHWFLDAAAGAALAWGAARYGPGLVEWGLALPARREARRSLRRDAWSRG